MPDDPRKYSPREVCAQSPVVQPFDAGSHRTVRATLNRSRFVPVVSNADARRYAGSVRFDPEGRTGTMRRR
jgi:hypothetical protein